MTVCLNRGSGLRHYWSPTYNAALPSPDSNTYLVSYHLQLSRAEVAYYDSAMLNSLLNSECLSVEINGHVLVLRHLLVLGVVETPELTQELWFMLFLCVIELHSCPEQETLHWATLLHWVTCYTSTDPIHRIKRRLSLASVVFVGLF